MNEADKLNYAAELLSDVAASENVSARTRIRLTQMSSALRDAENDVREETTYC